MTDFKDTATADRPLRVLCLHGLTQNADIMKQKLAPIMAAIPSQDFEFVFISAPYLISELGTINVGADHSLDLRKDIRGGRRDAAQESELYHRKREASAFKALSYDHALKSISYAENHRPVKRKYENVGPLRLKVDAILAEIDPSLRCSTEIELQNQRRGGGSRWWSVPIEGAPSTHFIGHEGSFAAISRAMHNDGPFDGIIGFSSGSMMAALCQALLNGQIPRNVEPTFQPPADQMPLKFALHFSPWLPLSGPYSALMETLPRNRQHLIPTLVFIGERDRSSPQGSCETFADNVAAQRVEWHDGGHSVPNWKHYPSFISAWLSSVNLEFRGALGQQEAEQLRARLESPYRRGRSLDIARL